MKLFQQLQAEIGDAVSDDDPDQYTVFNLMKRQRRHLFRDGQALLDLGCGTGDSFEKIREVFPQVEYTGVDIELSPEVANRSRNDIPFRTFDGVNLPFPDDHFDVIFCKQVLEHVRHPDLLMGEVARSLKPSGIFVGSVSFLEPYHSYSIFNWSPYGIKVVLEDCGLELRHLHHGIDGASMILRFLFGKRLFQNSFSLTSLLNGYVETEDSQKTIRQRNLRKIAMAGHLVFMAQKPKAGG